MAAGGCADREPTPAGEATQPRQSSAREAERERLQRELERLQQERERNREPPPALELAGLGSGLEGEIGVAAAPTAAEVAPAVRQGTAWSTIKVPIALRVLEDAGGPTGLSSAQADRIERALVESDNAAAAELYAELARRHGGSEGAATAVEELLRRSGDTATEVSTVGRDGFSPYGQTGWTPAAQVRFMAALEAGCLGSAAATEHLLGLMGRVSSDTWGLGSAGVPALWKGGWGPGTDGRYLVRQMGVLELGRARIPVALAAIAEDGSFESAQAIATEVAQRLVRRLRGISPPPFACPS